MIDSHCHLNFPPLVEQLAQLLFECQRQGIRHIHAPGTEARHWSTIIQLTERYSGLSASLGLHPYFLAHSDKRDLDTLTACFSAKPKNIVAVGEIGLDASLNIDMATQQTYFRAQLLIAKSLHLPVIIHHRKTHHLIMAELKRTGFDQGGVIHAFSGSLQQAEQYLELGFKLGFGGIVTYDRAIKTRHTLMALPDRAILLETDAPDMPVAGKQGEANSPLQLVTIAKCIAKLRQQTVEDVSQYTTDNFIRLFFRDEKTAYSTLASR